MMAGRKPKPDDLRRSASLGLRITQGLRTKLDESALAAGRSISEEVEARLKASFESDSSTRSRWGGTPQARALAGLFCRMTDEIEGHTGKPFQLDRFTHDHVVAGFAQLLRACRPEGTGEPPDSYPSGIVALEQQYPDAHSWFTDAQRAEWAKIPVGEEAVLHVLLRVTNEPFFISLGDDERRFYAFAATRLGAGHIKREAIAEIIQGLKKVGEPK